VKLPSWSGLVPFLLFASAFLILPAGNLLIGAFLDKAGAFTLENFAHLTRPGIVKSYVTTLQISAFSAAGGVFFGFLLAYAVTLGGLPQGLKSFLLTFSGVASNFAGVPLAFTFIATLGRVGLVTTVLSTVFGIDLYDSGFNLYSFWGLGITYLYFQIPLMVLLITPALEAIKPSWREAAESLGAGSLVYWVRVGLPLLLPAILASFIMLFGNAFGAYATAYALTGGLLNLVPILIGAQIRGDVLHDPNLGYALALGMVAIMTASIFAYLALQKQTSRWMT
jgi:putative spermidine/putrescine transport system permease protein